MKRTRIDMLRWPACLLPALAAACASPVVTNDVPAQERYRAVGQEPGWELLIADGRINYSGDYGETKINVARPDPRPTFNGLRYETPRLTVDVTYTRCNDAMSGQAYAHTVMVIADGKTVRGCGGEKLAGE